MSSATACMQASGSRSAPSASASHSAHLHRPFDPFKPFDSKDPSWGLARCLRGGFMDDTVRGGYDIFGGRRAQARRARNAAVLTRFWHEVEQYRRVPLREVST